MQGYFSYNLKGNKEELEQALEVVKRVSEGDEHEFLSEGVAKDLLLFEPSVAKDLYNEGSYVLAFEMPSSGNINSLDIDFDSMPYTLSESFVNLEIEGTGYLLDCEPYESFKSEKGSNTYEIIVTPVEFEYEEEDGDIDFDNYTITMYCPLDYCEGDLVIPLTKAVLEGTVEFVCEHCGTCFNITIYFSEMSRAILEDKLEA